MKAESISEVIEALVGPIDPVADSSIDEKRRENLEKLIAVADRIIMDIGHVGIQHKNSPYHSQASCGIIATKFLKDTKSYLEDFDL